MDPDLDAGLFDIHLSDSEDGANDAEPAEGGQPQRQEAEAPADRTAQSEEEFQSVRKGYVVKVENGEVRGRIPCYVISLFNSTCLHLKLLELVGFRGAHYFAIHRCGRVSNYPSARVGSLNPKPKPSYTPWRSCISSGDTLRVLGS